MKTKRVDKYRGRFIGITRVTEMKSKKVTTQSVFGGMQLIFVNELSDERV
ncbi:hypothetical protein QTG56_24110 (plasmid) [Rossellomorea sp. AcN35-11]|nr:hypothetical protein [Rossellomorea aquimaris]WJV31724.1 hypothetical protein QTG56_24110 [Rossellomorea sp. AcN35-11]